MGDKRTTSSFAWQFLFPELVVFNVSEVWVRAVDYHVFSGVPNGQTTIRDGWLTRFEEPNPHAEVSNE